MQVKRNKTLDEFLIEILAMGIAFAILGFFFAKAMNYEVLNTVGWAAFFGGILGAANFIDMSVDETN